MAVRVDRIDRYHQNMFEFDAPNAAWVSSCARYLETIFPEGVAGKRVVDYGFGRGNWSLAFRELGAGHVTAIDASAEAVARLSRIASETGIENLTVKLGNSDESDLTEDADLVFLYGILHHVRDPVNLLRSAARMCSASDGTVLVYAYNADSLRQTVAGIGRCAIGSDAQAFNDLRLTLHPDARIRAMDDLTAPIASFWTNEDLQDLLGQAGLAPTAQLQDFAAYSGNPHVPEFEPYVVSTSPAKSASAVPIIAQGSPNGPDLVHLETLATSVLDKLPMDHRVQFAVGLFNTSFAYHGHERYFERVFALWRYLVTAALALGPRFEASALSPSTRRLFDATRNRSPVDDRDLTDDGYSNADSSLAALINRGGFRL